MYFKAEQFKTVNDFSVPSISLIWVLRLIQMQDHVIVINSAYYGGNIEPSATRNWARFLYRWKK